MVLVVKLLLYPTCFPGVSHVKKTSRPGYERGSERLCVMAGVVSFPIKVELNNAVALGLFCEEQSVSPGVRKDRVNAR